MCSDAPDWSHLDATRAGEVLSILVKRHRHDTACSVSQRMVRSRDLGVLIALLDQRLPIGGVECLLDTVAVMDVNVDVKHSRVISARA